MAAGERNIEELKSLVAHTLETNGVLGQIRAQLRANVYKAIDCEEEQVPSATGSGQRPSAKLLKSSVGLLMAEIVAEFLEFYEFRHSLSVFVPESALELGRERRSRPEVAHEAGLVSVRKDSSILEQLVSLATGSDLRSLPKGGDDWHSSASSTTASSPPPSAGVGSGHGSAPTRPSTTDSSLKGNSDCDAPSPGERAERASRGGVAAGAGAHMPSGGPGGGGAAAAIANAIASASPHGASAGGGGCAVTPTSPDESTARDEVQLSRSPMKRPDGRERGERRTNRNEGESGSPAAAGDRGGAADRDRDRALVPEDANAGTVSPVGSAASATSAASPGAAGGDPDRRTPPEEASRDRSSRKPLGRLPALGGSSSGGVSPGGVKDHLPSLRPAAGASTSSSAHTGGGRDGSAPEEVSLVDGGSAGVSGGLDRETSLNSSGGGRGGVRDSLDEDMVRMQHLEREIQRLNRSGGSSSAERIVAAEHTSAVSPSHSTGSGGPASPHAGSQDKPGRGAGDPRDRGLRDLVEESISDSKVGDFSPVSVSPSPSRGAPLLPRSVSGSASPSSLAESPARSPPQSPLASPAQSPAASSRSASRSLGAEANEASVSLRSASEPGTPVSGTPGTPPTPAERERELDRDALRERSRGASASISGGSARISSFKEDEDDSVTMDDSPSASGSIDLAVGRFGAMGGVKDALGGCLADARLTPSAAKDAGAGAGSTVLRRASFGSSASLSAPHNSVTVGLADEESIGSHESFSDSKDSRLMDSENAEF